MRLLVLDQKDGWACPVCSESMQRMQQIQALKVKLKIAQPLTNRNSYHEDDIPSIKEPQTGAPAADAIRTWGKTLYPHDDGKDDFNEPESMFTNSSHRNFDAPPISKHFGGKFKRQRTSHEYPGGHKNWNKYLSSSPSSSSLFPVSGSKGSSIPPNSSRRFASIISMYEQDMKLNGSPSIKSSAIVHGRPVTIIEMLRKNMMIAGGRDRSDSTSSSDMMDSNGSGKMRPAIDDLVRH